MDYSNIPLVWVILGLFILPAVISFVTVFFTFTKDKAKIEADKDKDTGDISLKWATEFRTSLMCVEADFRSAKEEIDKLKRADFEKDKEIDKLKELNTNQSSRILKLENERGALYVEIESLRCRIRELEDENKKLKEC